MSTNCLETSAANENREKNSLQLSPFTSFKEKVATMGDS
jgi:hypothetical protein